MKEYIEFLLQMDKMETHQDTTTWNFRYPETKRKILKSSRNKIKIIFYSKYSNYYYRLYSKDKKIEIKADSQQ